MVFNWNKHLVCVNCCTLTNDIFPYEILFNCESSFHSFEKSKTIKKVNFRIAEKVIDYNEKH